MQGGVAAWPGPHRLEFGRPRRRRGLQVYLAQHVPRLPPALRIIDQQQRGLLAAMAVSDALGHVTHALAGCGKSTVLQCLVARYAKRHARMLDSEAGSRVLAFVHRTRTLRREFLQTLLHNQALQPGQVIFGGRLADRFLEAGVFDDDAARFQKIVLAMPEPSRLLPVYEEARAALVALHENTAPPHAVYNTWVQQDEAAALKRAAKGALGKLWSFHQAHSVSYTHLTLPTILRV